MIARLSLSHVRSYADAVIVPGPGLNVLTGENGAGKTNVLEAVSLLVPGRGLRGVALSDLAQTGGPGGFSIAARLDGCDIGVGAVASAPERKLVRINGVASPASALGERMAAVWVTPAMDRLFTGSAGERRRFLDRLVLALEPAHGVHVSRFDAAMRQRNRLLLGERAADPAWLDALEVQMADHGAAILRGRLNTVLPLSERLANEAEGPFARPLISLDQQHQPGDLAHALRQNRARDAAAGRALVGPHRADLDVRHATKALPASHCSTGEQKALLLGIVLAHAELVAERRGSRPVLLLDEVAAHLDPLRREALFARLSLKGGQVWLTGTEPALFAGAVAQHFQIEPGRMLARH